jgi:hypothetical protein
MGEFSVSTVSFKKPRFSAILYGFLFSPWHKNSTKNCLMSRGFCNPLLIKLTIVWYQQRCMDATKVVANAAKAGVSELELAELYHAELAEHGIKENWYPTLICAGQYSGQPLTRRNHRPSADVHIRKNDIVILDTTPMLGEAWGNWTITKSIGDDPFYKQLVADLFAVVIETAAEVLRGDYHEMGDIFSHVMTKAEARGLHNIDPRGNAGHTIFQIPEGQTVDKTPPEQRLYIDGTNSTLPERALVSIEPELARINPTDGVQYGGKFQFIIPVGYGDAGNRLVQTQYDFYQDMILLEDNELMRLSLPRGHKMGTKPFSSRTQKI